MSGQTMYRADPETSERAKRRADAVEILKFAAWKVVAHLEATNHQQAAQEVRRAIVEGDLCE